MSKVVHTHQAAPNSNDGESDEQRLLPTKNLKSDYLVDDDEEELEWRRIKEHQRTCQMRRFCVVAVLIIYAFLILGWKLPRRDR